MKKNRKRDGRIESVMISKAIEVMKNELECVKRADKCDRHCEDCPLMMDAEDIIEVYEWIIKKLKKRREAERKMGIIRKDWTRNV